MLAGVLTPTAGTVETSGRISALLELGAGFNGELTGVENIRQYCLLHGMSREEIEIALPKIVAFSELREAVKHPVKHTAVAWLSDWVFLVLFMLNRIY